MVWQCSKHSMRAQRLLCCTPPSPPPFFHSHISQGQSNSVAENCISKWILLWVYLPYESALLPYGTIKMSYARWQWTNLNCLKVWIGVAVAATLATGNIVVNSAPFFFSHIHPHFDLVSFRHNRSWNVWFVFVQWTIQTNKQASNMYILQIDDALQAMANSFSIFDLTFKNRIRCTWEFSFLNFSGSKECSFPHTHFNF